MRFGVVFGERDLRVRHHRVGIEHSQSNARLEEPRDGAVDVGLGQQAAFDGADERAVLVAAVEVGAGLDGIGRGLFERSGGVVVVEDVADGAAVRGDVAVEVPFVAQDVLEQPRVGAAGQTVRAVVGAGMTETAWPSTTVARKAGR